MYNEIDDKEMFMINSAKRKIKKDEYESFCKLIKTPTRLKNTQKLYYNKHISGKSVIANKEIIDLANKKYNLSNSGLNVKMYELD